MSFKRRIDVLVSYSRKLFQSGGELAHPSAKLVQRPLSSARWDESFRNDKGSLSTLNWPSSPCRSEAWIRAVLLCSAMVPPL